MTLPCWELRNILPTSYQHQALSCFWYAPSASLFYTPGTESKIPSPLRDLHPLSLDANRLPLNPSPSLPFRAHLHYNATNAPTTATMSTPNIRFGDAPPQWTTAPVRHPVASLHATPADTNMPKKNDLKIVGLRSPLAPGYVPHEKVDKEEDGDVGAGGGDVGVGEFGGMVGSTGKFLVLLTVLRDPFFHGGNGCCCSVSISKSKLDSDNEPSQFIDSFWFPYASNTR